jgi:hypothetical protein
MLQHLIESGGGQLAHCAQHGQREVDVEPARVSQQWQLLWVARPKQPPAKLIPA